MSNLKCRISQLEKNTAGDESKCPLIIFDEELTPEILQEVERAESIGRTVLRISFVDAKL